MSFAKNDGVCECCKQVVELVKFGRGYTICEECLDMVNSYDPSDCSENGVWDEPEDNMSDVEADADTLRSCGWGTDEDYGYDGMDYDFNMYSEGE